MRGFCVKQKSRLKIQIYHTWFPGINSIVFDFGIIPGLIMKKLYRGLQAAPDQKHNHKELT